MYRKEICIKIFDNNNKAYLTHTLSKIKDKLNLSKRQETHT